MDSFNIAALRGLQAGREYYVAMCPMHYLKYFLFDGSELPPELRHQRVLNKSRVPGITQYLLDNPKDYVFSSLFACIDSKVKFESVGNKGEEFRIGMLAIPMSAKIIINDGQHRKAAIEEALTQRPDLRDETISVVFFIDEGLKRSQQIFADLNRHAVRPTKSLGILYDHRDPFSQLALKVAEEVSFFNGLTEMEKTSISNRAIKLFTLSSIYQSTKALLKKGPKDKISSKDESLAIQFWEEIGKHIPDWKLAAQKKVSSAALREEYVHAHGVTLQALGILGSDLVLKYPKNWKVKLKKLSKVNWSRKNVKFWEGRALINGRLSKSNNSVLLTVNGLKKVLNLALTSEQKELEKQYSSNGKK